MTRYNETFIRLLTELSQYMSRKGETFRAKAYQKATETLMSYEGDITSVSSLQGLPHIGKSVMEKLTEFVQTGVISALEQDKHNPVHIFTDIYGVGPKKAQELANKGIRSIAQLREHEIQYPSLPLLNDVQKIGLQYYEDILERIPRTEIAHYEKIFHKTMECAIATITTTPTVAPPDPPIKMEIVGSYRRGADHSGDIDVIFTGYRPELYEKCMDTLIQKGVILHVLSRGPTKCLVITKLANKPARRVDFLFTSPREFPFAILYFTGSKIFNTVMRQYALEKGYTMNEHGICHIRQGVKGDAVEHPFRTEQDIFAFLGLEYKSPAERIDGRSIVPIPDASVAHTQENKIALQKSSPFPVHSNQMSSTIPTNTSTNTKKKQTAVASCTAPPLSVQPILNQLWENGVSSLHQWNATELNHLLEEAQRHYYNETPFLTDAQYDLIYQFVSQHCPQLPSVHQIGAKVEHNKVLLPYFMGSMNKITPDTQSLHKWKQTYSGPYVLSCKLDGISGLYSNVGGTPHLFTRGNGEYGQDISHYIPHLPIPVFPPNTVVRGELLMERATFQSKYGSQYANARNFVAGVIRHKTIQSAIQDVQFVCYEVIEPRLTPVEQMKFLTKWAPHSVVVHFLVSRPTELTNEFLSNTLVNWRENGRYETDGVIITNDALYERKRGNPDHSVAFKTILTDQMAEATVINVIWTPSKDGYLKPRIQIEPVQLGGVGIQYITGNNAAFIRDRHIGVGAVVQIIRSGDVIPKILRVLSPAYKIKWPSIPYEWNATRVDIMLSSNADANADTQSEEHRVVLEKNIVHFFGGIGVEGMKEGNVRRIVKAGFRSVEDILRMTLDDWKSVDGFQEKMAVKLMDGIRGCLNTCSLADLMVATNLFGRGFSHRKIELILEACPDILVSLQTDDEKIRRLADIKGMGNKTATAFVECIPAFCSFMRRANLDHLNRLDHHLVEDHLDTAVSPPSAYSHPLAGKTVVLTGFRDKDLMERLKKVGAKNGTSITQNTHLLVVPTTDNDQHAQTTKEKDAIQRGIPIMGRREFEMRYFP